MKKQAASACALRAALMAGCLLTPVAAFGHPADQHGTPGGHLPGTSSGDIELVSSLRVHDAAEGQIADVGAHGYYAYLAYFSQTECAGPEGTGPDGGIYVIDLHDPANPQEVGFIRAHQDSFTGEGVQVIKVDTAFFNGDLLIHNNESCGKNSKGGMSLWDVTDPTHPKKLVENFGDLTGAGGARETPHDAHQIHSSFAWDAGDKAYAMIIDDDETLDVDIVDITNPKKPKLVAETGLEEWPSVVINGNGDETFFHDVDVKQIDGQWIAVLSYWDAGWVLLNVTDPANPEFIADSDYPAVDPLTGFSPPEGNAHQAEWTSDFRFLIGTDEDFSPFRSSFQITTGPNVGEYPSGEFGFTAQIALTLPDGLLNGPTIFGGYGCNDDVADIPPASALGALDPGEESILVLSRGPVEDPFHNHEACRFDEKIANAEAKGYDAVIIANHHTGSNAGANPDAAFCGGGDPRPGVMAVCIGHRAYHLLFDNAQDYSVPYGSDEVASIGLGTIGHEVQFDTDFDGWGYVNLLDANSLVHLDAYAIPESLNQAFASGFGDLSVHEVATDPDDPNRAYLSYYAGGFRAIEIDESGPTPQLVETGAFIDENGNNFWGVQVWKHPDTGEKYILASDRDSGLWVFRNKVEDLALGN